MCLFFRGLPQEAVIELFAEFGGQGFAVSEGLVDSPFEFLVAAADIFVPDGEVLGIGRYAILGHQRQGEPGILGSLFVGFLVSCHGKVSCEAQ